MEKIRIFKKIQNALKPIMHEKDKNPDENINKKCFHPIHSRKLTHRGPYCDICGKRF